MPATRGRRTPQLLEQRPDTDHPSTAGFDRIYFCGRRKLTYLGDAYEPGDRMPDSVGVRMPRVDTKIRQGLIHVQYVPRSGEVPPPPPPAPDNTLAQALAANVQAPPTECEHAPASWQTVEHDGALIELCSECGARRPVQAEVPAGSGDGADGAETGQP